MFAKREEALFQYVLIIKKKEKAAHIDAVSISLCFISWVFFIFYCYLHQQYLNILFPASFLVPVLVIRSVMMRKKNQLFTYRHPLFISGVLWLLVPGMRWIALFFILFILFDHQSRQRLEIGISDKRIVINTFFPKKYSWNAFSNVMLKDNLLTLDFTDNRILQREIQPAAGDVDEAAFNAFCREQLERIADL